MRLLAAAALLLAACQGDAPAGPDPGEAQVGLEEVASGLSFPLLVTAPLTDQDRLFIVEKRGVIRLLKNGLLLPAPFLDISARVSTGSEQGLLGLAFHPDYATNRIFVINYTDTNGDTRVSLFRTSANPDLADPATEDVFLFVEQPFSNHNGGHVTFGPFGYLFIGLGDGGSGGDPGNRAQNLATPLGKLLRYQVEDNGQVSIPAGNPLVGNPGVLWGIWSWGLRNPWRFSFDRLTGDLYVADVGQSDVEEVNVVRAGAGFGRAVNFGWKVMEGSRCFSPSSGCDTRGLELPMIEYSHAEGCSVTGGHVYRGQAIPDLEGHYFYGDFCSGFVRSFRFANGVAGDPRDWPDLAPGGSITSFGEDALGELYIVVSSGRVYKIVPR